MTQEKSLLSIKYLDKSGNEIGPEASIENVEDVEMRINIRTLVNNKDLGTAILKGFMDERKQEFTNLIVIIRRKQAEQSKSKILVPGVNEQGLHVLQ